MKGHIEDILVGGRPMTKNEIKIKELQEDLGDMTKLFAIEKEKNRQAIEYLESYNTDFDNCKFGEAPISMRELGDLLRILKGSDKE